jgi:hypothetical protein
MVLAVSPSTSRIGPVAGQILRHGDLAMNNAQDQGISLEHKSAFRAVVVTLCFGLTSAFAQQPLTGTFTNIDPPAAAVAGAFGINNNGVIVGRYKTSSTNPYHAFIRDEAGSYRTIDPENALTAQAVGVNNSGSIVGYFCDTPPCGSISTYHGFLLNQGSLSFFFSPNHINTWPSRINDRGQIVGCDHDTDTMGTMHGFLDKNGTFSDLPVPASMNNGISPDGKTIVGLYTDMTTSASHGYILTSGLFIQFDVPGSIFTNAWDINAREEIVGAYLDSAGHLHGFLRTKAAEYLSIDYPGALGTWAFGLNDTGQIVGQYLDASGNRRSYLLSTTTD